MVPNTFLLFLTILPKFSHSVLRFSTDIHCFLTVRHGPPETVYIRVLYSCIYTRVFYTVFYAVCLCYSSIFIELGTISSELNNLL